MNDQSAETTIPAGDEYIHRTLRAYDDVAKYEGSTREMVPRPELDELVSYLPTGASVLDAGCAFGRDTAYLKSLGLDVRGIDMSPALIERAKELLADVDFQVRDVRSTGFADGQFDGIWCNATLLHLTDADIIQAVTEFGRILKPDGVIAVSLKKGTGTQQFVESFSSDSERFFNFHTHESFRDLLRQAGLVEVGWHYLNERERYGEGKRDLDWLYTYAKKIHQ